jgi:hypothetical protein
MNTYIDDKKTIPVILENGWTIKNNTWTNCPPQIYNQIKKEL